MLDPGSIAAVKFSFDAMLKLLGMVSEKDRAFFDKVIEPSYRRFLEIHFEYIRMFRILDSLVTESDVDKNVINKFVDARKKEEAKRDFFRHEIDIVVVKTEDCDNRRFLAALFMYFIIDEDVGMFFDDDDIDRHVKSMREHRESGGRWGGDREFNTPSMRIARLISSEKNNEEIIKIKNNVILTLGCRAHSITELYVRIRYRYYKN